MAGRDKAANQLLDQKAELEVFRILLSVIIFK